MVSPPLPPPSIALRQNRTVPPVRVREKEKKPRHLSSPLMGFRRGRGERTNWWGGVGVFFGVVVGGGGGVLFFLFPLIRIKKKRLPFLSLAKKNQRFAKEWLLSLFSSGIGVIGFTVFDPLFLLKYPADLICRRDSALCPFPPPPGRAVRLFTRDSSRKSLFISPPSFPRKKGSPFFFSSAGWMRGRRGLLLFLFPSFFFCSRKNENGAEIIPLPARAGP